MTSNCIKSDVSNILQNNPFEVVDDDTNHVYSSLVWELCELRSTGDCKGMRIIGSGNLMTALNVVYTECIDADKSKEDTMAEASTMFKTILKDLSDEKTIRHKPEQIRKTFRAV